MLEATPLNWFSWELSITDQQQHIANIDFSWWREKGTLEINGEKYSVYREGASSGAFMLQHADEVLARAEKPSSLRNRFVIEHKGLKFTLEPRGIFSRGFLLVGEAGVLGTLSASSLFSRRMQVDLPEALPISVRVFIVWLAVLIWRRDASAA